LPEPFQFADVLGQFVQQTGYTPGQIARLSGIPQATITNWLEGRVKKPRQRSNLLRLARALNLDVSEATQLLEAAGHPALHELMQTGADTEQELLAPWQELIYQREQAPFQAIADLPYFVGRQLALQTIQQALLDDQHQALCSLYGMGGVGKTVLAAHAAYRLRPHFPDGVLWARVDRAAPLSILRAFANAYDQDVDSYPDVDSRSQVVRALLASKRALLILDGAQTSDQIRPLLPPSGRCAVLITTRRPDLAIVRGARRIRVEPFRRESGATLELFTHILGRESVHQNRNSLAQIAERLGHLPLAVAIAANRLAHEPNWRMTEFLQRLRPGPPRLRELAYGDWDVAACFAESYETLPAWQQRFFATLSLLKNDEFSIQKAAAVFGTSPAEAHDLLRTLYSHSLVQTGRKNRYRLHPLLHDFALETRQQTFESTAHTNSHAWAPNAQTLASIVSCELAPTVRQEEIAQNRMARSG